MYVSLRRRRGAWVSAIKSNGPTLSDEAASCESASTVNSVIVLDISQATQHPPPGKGS